MSITNLGFGGRSLITKEPERNEYGRQLLPGGVPMGCVAVIKDTYSNTGVKLVGINGWSPLSQAYQYSSILPGGQGICHPQNLIKVLYEQNFWLESPVTGIARFYYEWKRKEVLICPKCKKEFLHIHQWLLDGGTCFSCKEGKDYSADKLAFKFVELTDEMLKEHNRQVVKNNFRFDPLDLIITE